MQNGSESAKTRARLAHVGTSKEVGRAAIPALRVPQESLRVSPAPTRAALRTASKPRCSQRDRARPRAASAEARAHKALI